MDGCLDVLCPVRFICVVNLTFAAAAGRQQRKRRFWLRVQDHPGVQAGLGVYLLTSSALLRQAAQVQLHPTTAGLHQGFGAVDGSER